MVGRLKTFMREVRVEMSKVPRVKREELIGSTTVVLSVMLIVAVIVGILDYICRTVILIVLSRIAG